MRQCDLFVCRHEHQVVFAHDLTTAQGCETDGSVWAGAVLIETHDVLKGHASPFRNSPANRKGCARGSIYLLAMMNFYNFSIVSRQTSAKLFGKLQEQRQGWGEIGGLKDRNKLCSLVDRSLIISTKACRTENPRAFRICKGCGVSLDGRRMTDIDHNITVLRKNGRVRRDVAACIGMSGQTSSE